MINTNGKVPTYSDLNNPADPVAAETYAYHLELFSHFLPQYDRADRNKNLVFFNHWTEDEMAKHENKNRMPLNFPMIYRLVMNLLGYEKNYPSMIQTEPFGQEDEVTSFLYSLYLKYIQEQTKPVRYKYQRSDVFQNGNVGLFGASEIIVRENKYTGNDIYVKSIPYNQVMFDVNFTDYEMSECSRMQYFEDVWGTTLIEEYPEKKDLILSLADSFRNTYENHKILRNFYNRSDVNRDKIIIRKIVDYIKEDITCHYVYTPNGTYEFDSAADAKSFRDVINAGKEIAYYAPEKEVGIFKTVLANNVLLEDKKLLDVRDEFPLTIYFPVFHNGEYTNIVEICKDLQKYHDRLYSQLDYNLGIASKILLEANKNKIDKSISDDEWKKIIEDGGVLWTSSDQEVFKQKKFQAADAQYFQVIESLKILAEDNFGGKNFQGVQQYSNQSGIAIEKLQSAATMLASTYIDNLERYSENLGRKLVKYIAKYFDSKKQFKIIGDYTNQQMIQVLQANGMYQQSLTNSKIGYVTVNDPSNPASKLQPDFNYSIKIVNKDYNQFDKENMLQKIMMLKQQGFPIDPEIEIELYEFDPITKAKIIEGKKQLDEQQRVMAVEAQKTERLKAMSPALQSLVDDKKNMAQIAATPEAAPEEEGTPSGEPVTEQPQGDVDALLDNIMQYL